MRKRDVMRPVSPRAMDHGRLGSSWPMLQADRAVSAPRSWRTRVSAGGVVAWAAPSSLEGLMPDEFEALPSDHTKIKTVATVGQ